MPMRWIAPTVSQSWHTGRNNFNLMRLLAAWLVIYGHAWAVTGAAGQDLVAWLTGFRYAGAVAVDVFFVVSGFLIAASLQRNDVRGYLASRALRLLPGLAACVLLSVLVMGPLLSNAVHYWRDGETWRYLWVNASLIGSTFQLPGVFESLPRAVVNASLWTLPIEARLYLALLVAGLAGLLTPRRYTPLWLLAVVAAFAFAWWRQPLPEYLANDLWCAGFFITGTALWINRDRVRLSWWIFAALLVTTALARGSQWIALPYAAALAYGTLLVALRARLPVIERIDLSYGIYLYGWPAQQLVQQCIAPQGTPLQNVAWATPLALLLAAGSWCLVERPALRLKKHFGTRSPAASPAAAAA